MFRPDSNDIIRLKIMQELQYYISLLNFHQSVDHYHSTILQLTEAKIPKFNKLRIATR